MTIQTFAGFKLPRTGNGPTIYNPTLTDLSFRLENWKGDNKTRDNKTRGNIGRVTYPNNIRTADTAREFSGWGTYLEDERILGLRWAWCDEIPSDWGVSHRQLIDHRGWLLGGDMHDDTARGIVLKLPHGRGYLTGWSLGEGMITEIDCDIHADARDAVYAADSMAENMAEGEREYRAACCDECGEHEDDCKCISVYFRVFDDGDAIALWDEPSSPGMISSYQTVGQHSGADAVLIDELDAAPGDGKRALWDELERIGYNVKDADGVPFDEAMAANTDECECEAETYRETLALEFAHYGFVSTPLSEDETAKLCAAGVSRDDAYAIGCDVAAGVPFDEAMAANTDECEADGQRAYLIGVCESALRGLDFAHNKTQIRREADKLHLAVLRLAAESTGNNHGH